MLYNLYIFDHNVLHLCFWTLPALLLAVAMAAVGLVHGHRQKKREKEFEEQLEEKLEKMEASPAEEGSEGICHT